MKWTAARPLPDNKFVELIENWNWDLNNLRNSQKQKKRPAKADIKRLEEAVQNSWLAMDSYNRYVMAARGASSDVYGILLEVAVEKEFKDLLNVTMQTPTHYQGPMIQHMRPLERLGDTSHHTAWMSEYVVDEDVAIEMCFR